ncbi:hypothetical protein LIER_40446 [Lithospermum erythrorhizon]|uniref:ATP-dependent DNA helicase n=1 Tax=Lithospermum erythrorhizon TaxID=34254 RepID=A0AAV3QX62_LITER
MRARDDPGFIDYLSRIGNGEEPTNSKGQVKLPDPMVIPYTNLPDSLEALISYVYPDMNLFDSTPFEMMKRSILCPKNEFIDDINSKLIERLHGEEIIYVSDDRARNTVGQGDYVDYLNTLKPRGLPYHRLTLKKTSLYSDRTVQRETCLDP